MSYILSDDWKPKKVFGIELKDLLLNISLEVLSTANNVV